jgi:molecular chaperone DnaK
VTITASTNLDKLEIERMVNQARQNEAEDRRLRQLVEARNTGDSLAYQTEKTLRDLADKVPSGERQSIENKVNDLREALKGDDLSRIQSLSNDLQNALHALSQQLYAQQSQPGGPQMGDGWTGGTAGGGSDEGEVVEGEFREA